VYVDDYASLEPLKVMCDDIPGLATLVVTHTNQRGNCEDILESIGGSNGLTGSVIPQSFCLVLEVSAKDASS